MRYFPRNSLTILLIILTTLCGIGFYHSPAFAQDVKLLKQQKDVLGLVRLLRSHDGKIRASAAVALSGIIREITDAGKLTPHVLPLVDITLRDPYITVREYAGRSLQHCLQNISDVSILRAVVPPLIDSLNAGEVEEKRRRYCAVQLSRVIPKIQHEPLLVQSIPILLAATISDPHEEVREYAGRALKSALPRVRDTKTLHNGSVSLTRLLKHPDLKRRRYASVLLAWLVPKLKSLETLRTISTEITNASQQDSDETVREYARRAARDIKKQLDAKLPKK